MSTPGCHAGVCGVGIEFAARVQIWGCWTCCPSRASCRGCCCTQWRLGTTAATRCSRRETSTLCSARRRINHTRSISPSTPATITGYGLVCEICVAPSKRCRILLLAWHTKTQDMSSSSTPIDPYQTEILNTLNEGLTAALIGVACQIGTSSYLRQCWYLGC